MTPQEFVTKVYNVQEGVILDDLYPTDDKYREVLYQANLVIDEFTKQQDWSFLRQGIVLGDTVPSGRVPKFILPEWVDRVSLEFNDGIKLHPMTSYKCECDCHDRHKYHFIEDQFINVPFTSAGNIPERDFMAWAAPLMAHDYGNYIEFTRQPYGDETNKVATVDVQVKIPHLHICTDKCKVGKNPEKPISYEPGDNYNPCKHIEEHIFDRRYADYIIWKTAYQTSKYSPIAGGIRAELNDNAMKLLSKLRQIDAAKTTPDIIKHKQNFKVRQVW